MFKYLVLKDIELLRILHLNRIVELDGFLYWISYLTTFTTTTVFILSGVVTYSLYKTQNVQSQ